MKHSIIIPTAGDAPYLCKTLESLIPVLDASRTVEVIVVENGPELGKESRVETFKRMLDLRLRKKVQYLYEPTWGLLAGRHRGVLSTDGDIISFFDDDVVVDGEFSSTIYKAFLDKSVELLGGPARPILLGFPPVWLKEAAEINDHRGFMMTSLSLIDLRVQFVRNVNPNYIWGQNFHIRRHTLMELRGFHPDGVPNHLQRFRGDGETGLTMKFAAEGRRADYLAGLGVRHYIPTERMTYGFLERRSFLHGVSDAYSHLRAGGSHRTTQSPNSSFSRFFATWRPSARPIGRRRANVERIRNRAHAAGKEFLGREYMQDSKLREWLHRPDYFDYTYPHE